MPKKRYALIRGGPKEIELSWGWGMKKIIIRQNGQNIGLINSVSDLKKGVQIQLSEGNLLLVKLNPNAVNNTLEISCNGKPIPGSARDPWLKIRNAVNGLIILAALNFILGAAYIFSGREFQMVGYCTIGLATINLLLAMAIKKRSFLALYSSFFLVTVEIISGMYYLLVFKHSITFVWILLNLLILIYLLQALQPMKRLKN